MPDRKWRELCAGPDTEGSNTADGEKTPHFTAQGWDFSPLFSPSSSLTPPPKQPATAAQIGLDKRDGQEHDRELSTEYRNKGV